KAYGSIDVRVSYAAANGGFSGSGATVACTPNASLNAAMAFNDLESITRLNGSFMHINQVTGPAVLFTCTFDSNSGTPSAANFTITIYDWSSTTTTTAPVVQISRIQAL